MSSEFVFSAQSDHNLQATKKPPDPQKPSSPKISFRDKLLGPSQEPIIREKEDMIEKKLVRIEHENGNRLLPKVYLEPSVFQELCTPWKDAIVVKLLGKNLGYHTMKERLQKTWRLQGGFEIMDNDNGFYMVKFDQAADKEKVITGGPWLIFDHCLAVTHWSPEFASPNAKVDKTIVWVRFPGLNLVYYDESFLLAMASALGRPIKVDTNTLKIERGKFARVCVEIDLTVPVVGKIWVNGHWYKVQYEGLHLICTNCGCYGHLGRNCPATQIQKTSTQPTSHQATAAHQGVRLQANQPATIEVHSIPENQKGKAVTDWSNESITNDDKIIGIDGENNELHGDWLLVTRKKKQPKNPKPILPKTVTSKGNSFNALNKAGPPNRITQPHLNPTTQPRAPHMLKETKRRRHDDFTLDEPVFDHPSAQTSMLSPPIQKTAAKPAYVAKDKNFLTNSQHSNSDLQKHETLDSSLQTPDPKHNSNIMQTDHDPNNSNKAQSSDTNQDVHNDNVVPKSLDACDANEVDMVT